MNDYKDYFLHRELDTENNEDNILNYEENLDKNETSDAPEEVKDQLPI
ncbi:hypothetical protein [Candidatus Vesicomyidisocius sp. SY067_SCS001]|nr:hypothetical protein [Candidatus Vesicomyosocius sp. SY067_SCS001]